MILKLVVLTSCAFRFSEILRDMLFLSVIVTIILHSKIINLTGIHYCISQDPPDNRTSSIPIHLDTYTEINIKELPHTTVGAGKSEI